MFIVPSPIQQSLSEFLPYALYPGDCSVYNIIFPVGSRSALLNRNHFKIFTSVIHAVYEVEFLFVIGTAEAQILVYATGALFFMQQQKHLMVLIWRTQKTKRGGGAKQASNKRTNLLTRQTASFINPLFSLVHCTDISLAYKQALISHLNSKTILSAF